MTPIIIRSRVADITIITPPKQVKKAADLPNWYVTLYDTNTGKAVKVYLQINLIDGVGLQEPVEYYKTSFSDTLKKTLTLDAFTAMYGELEFQRLKLPGDIEGMEAAKEVHNFFRRRGRDIKSMIEESSEYRHQYTDNRTKKLTPITLALDSDTIFKTTQSHACFKRNYKCISGTVSILGQTHHFELSHPLFDLSLIMTAGDARKNIVAGLRKAFPFIDAADVKNWTFDNQVQGK